MANEQNLNEELGGIVTTVKTQETSDLDVRALLEANKEEIEAAGGASNDEEKATDQTPEVKVETKKAGEPKATTAEPKKEKTEDDDDSKPLDFNSLSPAEQKLVAKAFKQQRLKDRKETRETREKLATLEAEIAGLKKGATATEQPKPKAATIEKPSRPRRREFPEGQDGDDAFDAAMDKFQDDDYSFRKAQDLAAQRAAEQRDADQKSISAFNEAADKFMEEHEDYEDVMDSDAPLTAIMFGYMVENAAPELGYFWAQHPEEAEKISKMAPRQQERAIVRLHVKLEQEAEAAATAAKAEADKNKKTTTATPGQKPEPPKPVAARGNTTVAKDPAKMSFREREKEYARTHPGVLNYEP